MSDAQKIVDDLFAEFVSGELTRHEYVRKMDQVYLAIMDERERGAVAFRKDKRSLGEFALFLYDNTVREKFLMDSWCDLMVARDDFSDLQYKNRGLENSGRLIIDADEARKTAFADFWVWAQDGTLLPDGWTKLEMKFDPSLTKATFKVGQLKSYIKQGAYMLVIMCNGQLGPNGNPNQAETYSIDSYSTRWFLASPATMERMLTKRFSQRSEMGGKSSVQFLNDEILDYFDVMDWSKKNVTGHRKAS